MVVAHGIEQLHCHTTAGRQGGLLFQKVGEGAPIHVFHHDAWPRHRIHLMAVKMDDVGVVERRQHVEFLLQHGHVERVVPVFGLQAFQHKPPPIATSTVKHTITVRNYLLML